MYDEYREAARRSILYPPLGLTILSTLAKQAGWEPAIFDGELYDDFLSAFKEKTHSFSPDILGITACTPTFHLAVSMAKLARETADIPILFGGPHATVLYEQVLKENPFFDLVFVGEAEKSFSRLFRGDINDRSAWHKIPGLSFIDDAGKIIFTGPPELTENLDEVPIGARDLLSHDAYRWSLPGAEGRRFATMNTSRGCPFRCVFCTTYTLFGHRIRAQSHKRVVSEIIKLNREEGVGVIGFMDDNFTLGKERILSICKGINKEKPDLLMDCWTSAATLSSEITKTMHGAGFVRVNIGIESGDPQILKATKKGIDLNQVRQAVSLAKQAGLETCGYAILGLPGETRTTAMRTINFLRNLKGLDYAYLTVAAPLPGTVMYDMAKKGEAGLRLLTEDFSKFKRYANPIIEVNDLTAKDLVRLQRIGLLKIYLKPNRIWRLLRRTSIKETWKNIMAFIRSMVL